MWIRFAHHQGGFGGRRAYGAGGMEKVLLVFFAFILAVVARYAVTMWVERKFGDPGRANIAGWVAFFFVLVVIGFGGVKLL
jgi:hypothetical protein